MAELFNSIDKGREIDWGKTSIDYAAYRSGPPDSFYKKLHALNIGLKGQKILDLGTGTGVLARQFAQQGAIVSGIDIASEQIEQAKKLAKDHHLNIDFRVSPAESIPFPDNTFDIATANQCFLYFDKPKVFNELKRLFTNNSKLLVTSYFLWLPRVDKIAAASEKLVLKHNPNWSAADYDGYIPAIPDWAINDFNLQAMFTYDEAIPFSQETWRGRMRACRGVGAALSENEVMAFDKEHAELLINIAPEKFTILHKIVAHVLELKR